MLKIIYKIKIYCRVCVFCLAGFPAFGQDFTLINSREAHCNTIAADSLKEMVELKQLIPEILYDLKYAGKNNFTNKRLYASGRLTFLRKEPANALAKISNELEKKGYRIKVFDAYRPFSITQKMWELIGDERYVAHPSKGSGHNRGLSIDLTLVSIHNGKELDMGTGFDHFSDTAHHEFRQLPLNILENRKLLKDIMEKNGFKSLSTEWWHYSWPNNRNYEVLDIPHRRLYKICN